MTDLPPGAPPPLFDRDLLHRRRARAARAPADFLHEEPRRARSQKGSARLTEGFARPRWSAAPGRLGRRDGGGVPPAVAVPDAEVLGLAPGAHDLVVHGWRCTGRTIRSASSCRRGGRSCPTGCSSRAVRRRDARRAARGARRGGGRGDRRASARGWRRWARCATSARCCSGRASPCRWPTPAARRQLCIGLRADARPAGDGRDQRACGPAAPPDPARRARARARLYAERFRADGGRVRATFEVVVLTGWAPAESQPQPLRPGSARARLAEALGAEERPAGERAGPAPSPRHRS
jgi:hypothetical protein